jgi:hypothetical protein
MPTTPDPTSTAPASLSAVTLEQTTVVGDATIAGAVVLTSNAGSNGVVVALSSNNAAVSVPASVTVPAGSARQPFTARTFAPSANSNVTLTVSYAGVAKTVDVLVQAVATPPTPHSITGNWAGRFTCSSPAPCAGGFVDFQLSVVQGVSATGSCALSDGRSGTFALSSATTWNSNPIDLQGGCITGNLDVEYHPADDTLRGFWKADYGGVLTRR